MENPGLTRGGEVGTTPLQVEVSFSRVSCPRPQPSHSLFLEIQTKGCFSMFKEKVKTKHNTSQVITLGPSSLFLFLSLPSLSTCPFLIWLFCLSYFSHSLSGILGLRIRSRDWGSSGFWEECTLSHLGKDITFSSSTFHSPIIQFPQENQIGRERPPRVIVPPRQCSNK